MHVKISIVTKVCSGFNIRGEKLPINSLWPGDMCASAIWVIIGSGNGLVPVWHHYLTRGDVLSLGPFSNKLQCEIWIKIHINIYHNVPENCVRTCTGFNALTLLVLKPEYCRLIMSILSWLLMPCFLGSPSHQQPCYWMCMTYKLLSSMWKDFKSRKCKFIFSKINSVCQGWVIHICIGILTITGSDNGLSPGQCQAIIWPNAGILLNRPLETNLSETSFEICTFSFKKMCLKLPSVKWRSCCPNLNVLICLKVSSTLSSRSS